MEGADIKDKAIGEEYIDEWRNPVTGAVIHYCTLCGCQFDNKLIVPHAKGLGHKLQYKEFKEIETTDDRLVNAKHLQISLSKEEFESVQDIVLDCEKAFKRLSDKFAQGTTGNDKKNCEESRMLTGVMRCGLLSAGLLMTGETNVELILLTAEKPTVALLQRIADELPNQLVVSNSRKYKVAKNSEEACVIVTSVKDPAVSCQITVTCPLMRTHPFRYYNEIAPADPVDVLPRDKCEEALRRMRQARWYEAKVYPLPYADQVIRIFRDLCLRVPTWTPLQLWVIEVLVQKCLSCADANTSSPARAVQAVFECFASGIIQQDGPGLYDPCEREPTDLCQLLSLQERECITTSAQHALRLMAYGNVHRILGLPESVLLSAQQATADSKRKRNSSDDSGLESLPKELQKNFSQMRDLDTKSQDILMEIDQLADDYLKGVRGMDGEHRKEHLNGIQKLFNQSKKFGDEKVQLALQTYEMVDKHIRRLDADLARFEAELKEQPSIVGKLKSPKDGKLSKDKPTKEKLVAKDKDSKKKKRLKERGTDSDSESTKKKRKKPTVVEEPKMRTASLLPLATGHPSDVLDMPVDPNEPTYCLCHQVSYGEMIGCDNQDCQIEWFHFACVGLTTKPKGKWYCPRCTIERKKKA